MRVAKICASLGCMLMLAGTWASPGYAQAGQPGTGTVSPAPAIRAVRATAAIVLDGKLDEKDWQTTEPARNFTQRDPNEGQPATEATDVRFLFDDDALYIGARMWDREPARIARRLSRRDGSAEGLADTIVVSL